MEARDRLKESEKALSENIYERRMDDAGFGRIRSKGDEVLFGGNTTQMMKKRFGITNTRPLADFLSTLTIAAKNLATEMTNHNVDQDNLRGEPAIQLSIFKTIKAFVRYLDSVELNQRPFHQK